MIVAMLAPTMFRGNAVMTRKRGILIESPAGRGKLGAREVMRFRLLTCLPIRKGISFRLVGRLVLDGHIYQLHLQSGAIYELAPIPNTMKEPY